MTAQSSRTVPPTVKLSWWRWIRTCQTPTHGTPGSYSRRIQSRERWWEPNPSVAVVPMLSCRSRGGARSPRFRSRCRSPSRSRIYLHPSLSRSNLYPQCRSLAWFATTQVVPFLPCGRRQARIIPAAVAYAYRVLDPWHTFSQSGSYTSPRNSGGECLGYRLFLMVAIKHGWNLQVKDVQWYQADTRGQFKVMYT